MKLTTSANLIAKFETDTGRTEIPMIRDWRLEAWNGEIIAGMRLRIIQFTVAIPEKVRWKDFHCNFVVMTFCKECCYLNSKPGIWLSERTKWIVQISIRKLFHSKRWNQQYRISISIDGDWVRWIGLIYCKSIKRWRVETHTLHGRF
jgi:hypothetical protein